MDTDSESVHSATSASVDGDVLMEELADRAPAGVMDDDEDDDEEYEEEADAAVTDGEDASEAEEEAGEEDDEEDVSEDEEEEEAEQSDSESQESDDLASGTRFFMYNSFARHFANNARLREQFQRLPIDVPPLQGELAQQLCYKLMPQQHTERAAVLQDTPPGSPTAPSSSAPSTSGPMSLCSPTPDPQPPRRATRAATRAAKAAAAASTSTAPAPAGPSDDSVQLSPGATYSVPTVSLHKLLSLREAPHAPPARKPARAEQLHISSRYIPQHFRRQVDSMYSKAYIGQYSADGSFFVAAFQDRRIRIYDAHNNYRLRKDLRAPNLYWTITDTTLSADRSLLLYSTISPIVYVAKVGSSEDPVTSISNVTDIHDELCFNNSHLDPRHQLRVAMENHYDFGIWSIQWGPSRPEVIAGTNDPAVCVYDLEAQCVQVRVAGHLDDVNAVAYLDSSGQVVVTGSDDHTIQLWDRRMMRNRGGGPQGVLLGHREGITHVDPKGDGRYLISNAKDQTTKLWDVRRAYSPARIADLPRVPPLFHWDYRSDRYPGEGYAITHPHDCSLMTYRGHRVLKTLIRAYWTPEHTTGQRYIYTGSMDGGVRVYDVLTGRTVAELRHHDKPVRDCSWHPTRAELMSVSWDGTVALWGAEADAGSE